MLPILFISAPAIGIPVKMYTIDLISVGKLIRNNDGPEEVEQLLNTLTKYSGNGGFGNLKNLE